MLSIRKWGCFGGKIGVALNDMSANFGSIENAKMVSENTEERSVDDWNAMIGSHSLGGETFCRTRRYYIHWSV